MCYLVTALAPAAINAGRATPQSNIHDTIEEAKAQAENFLKLGMKEVSVWKQVATPTIQQTVTWE